MHTKLAILSLIIAATCGVGCAPMDNEGLLDLNLVEESPSEAPAAWQDSEGEASPTPETHDSFYLDADNDGLSAADGDCDDTNADTHPGAPELCGDHRDNDCDRFTDEPSGLGAQIFFADQDGDGFGDPVLYLTLCEAITGFVDDASDCDDHDARVHPDAAETCGADDMDCDGDPERGALDVLECEPLDGGPAFEACTCPDDAPARQDAGR